MNKENVYVLLASTWDEKEETLVTKCCSEKVYNLSIKEDLKKLAVDSVNYLAKGYKLELISVSNDFISMMSQYKILYRIHK